MYYLSLIHCTHTKKCYYAKDKPISQLCLVGKQCDKNKSNITFKQVITSYAKHFISTMNMPKINNLKKCFIIPLSHL
jgi:hypothetical protein